METSYRCDTMKTAMQQLHEHLVNSWSSPGDLWRPDKIIEKVESMIELEKKNTMETKRELDPGMVMLPGDPRLNKSTTDGGSVAAPKEEEQFDKHKFFDRVSTINAKKDITIESLQSENTALREALKELLPIAENAAYFAGFLPQFTGSELEQYENESKPIIERARKLLSK